LGAVDKQTREQLERERKRLVLAASDMRQAAAAASHLGNVRMNDDVERVLWTGLVVTYARPYQPSNELGAVRGKLARPEDEGLRPLHENLLKRRGPLFAHNTESEHRGIEDPFGSGRYTESYAPTNPEALPGIERLANEQEKRFRKRLEAVEEELREQARP
jgi:hypothetical protein